MMFAKNWNSIIQPSKLSKETLEDDKNGSSIRFTIEPLARGLGHTIGNSLRRVLISSIYGAAVTSLKIEGVLHELQTINGVKEDIQHIIVNLKKLVISSQIHTPTKLQLNVKGPAVVTAKDISLPISIKILNPEQVLFHINDDQEVNMEMEVEVGSGYRDVTEAEEKKNEIGFINISAYFSPVKKVNYSVESSRVGRMTDYDKLILDVTTDGSVDAMEALGIAAKIIKEQLRVFINFDENVFEEQEKETEIDKLDFDMSLLRKVEELELSVRSQNCLKNEDIIYIGDLVVKSENDMLRTPNFGKKSLNEIKQILSDIGLGFDMKIDSWPPENIDVLIKELEEENK